MKMRRQTGIDLGLTDEDKKILHNLARTTIEKKLKKDFKIHQFPETDILKKNRGAFVTLLSRGKLRGCIGCISAIKPLNKIIPEMALAAAFNDPRFDPLQSSELKDLEIELSVLTPMQQVMDIEEIETGRHGLMIIKDHYSGLLLPQVATDNNWNRNTFLEQTCIKAGLPLNAWKDRDTEIYLFSADVF